MSTEVAAPRSGRVDRHRVNEEFLDVVLDDPDFLEAEFAAIVDGLDPASVTGGDGPRSARPADHRPPPDGEDDVAAAGATPTEDRATAARPPPRSSSPPRSS